VFKNVRLQCNADLLARQIIEEFSVCTSVSVGVGEKPPDVRS
jgi:hypothetical protein